MSEHYVYQPVCQDCGARGESITGSNPNPNLGPARVTFPSRCPTPLNGKPNEAPHRTKWEIIRVR